MVVPVVTKDTSLNVQRTFLFISMPHDIRCWHKIDNIHSLCCPHTLHLCIDHPHNGFQATIDFFLNPKFDNNSRAMPNKKLCHTSVHCAVSAVYILPLNNLNCHYKEHILNPYKLDQLDIHDFGDNLNHKVHQYKQLVIRNLNHLSKFLRCKYHWSISYPKRLVFCCMLTRIQPNNSVVSMIFCYM